MEQKVPAQDSNEQEGVAVAGDSSEVKLTDAELKTAHRAVQIIRLKAQLEVLSIIDYNVSSMEKEYKEQIKVLEKEQGTSN